MYIRNIQQTNHLPNEQTAIHKIQQQQQQNKFIEEMEIEKYILEKKKY